MVDVPLKKIWPIQVLNNNIGGKKTSFGKRNPKCECMREKIY